MCRKTQLVHRLLLLHLRVTPSSLPVTITQLFLPQTTAEVCISFFFFQLFNHTHIVCIIQIHGCDWLAANLRCQ